MYEAFIVPPQPKVKPVTMDKLLKPIIFHEKPTPLVALLTILWIPIGFLLAYLQIAASALLSMPLVYYAFMALGVCVTSPACEETVSNNLPIELTCSTWKSSHEVANYIQKVIAELFLMSAQASLARRDKYGDLAGNDGTVVEKPLLKANKVMGC